MEEKLSDILKDNKSLQASIDDLNKVCMFVTLNLIKFYLPLFILLFIQEYEFSDLKKSAMQKVNDYNHLLRNDLNISSQNKY